MKKGMFFLYSLDIL